MTRAPRSAITRQIADPIPPEAPVTRTVTRVASPRLVIATSLPPRLDLRDFSFRQLHAKDASLQKLHDNVADFIRRTSRGGQ